MWYYFLSSFHKHSMFNCFEMNFRKNCNTSTSAMPLVAGALDHFQIFADLCFYPFSVCLVCIMQFQGFYSTKYFKSVFGELRTSALHLCWSLVLMLGLFLFVLEDDCWLFW